LLGFAPDIEEYVAHQVFRQGLVAHDANQKPEQPNFVSSEECPHGECIIDLFSRRVVGWSMSAAMTAQLVTDALVMAIWRRGKPDALLHHSDRGSPIHQRAGPAADGRQRRRLLDDAGDGWNEKVRLAIRGLVLQGGSNKAYSAVSLLALN
jgi:transposase InsO family protein